MAPRRKLKAAEKKSMALEHICRLSDEALCEFENSIKKDWPRRDKTLVLSAIAKERERRSTALDDFDQLIKMSSGRIDLHHRPGRHKTVLGDDVWEDRNARIAIIWMYQHVTKILDNEPRDSSDPLFVQEWLIGYLANVECIPTSTARQITRKALKAVKDERRRGIPSKGRRIVREVLASVGFCRLSDGNRRKVTLSDLRLRRIIERGDPLKLPKPKAEKARKKAAREGLRIVTDGVLVAWSDLQSSSSRWRLFLKRRRNPDCSEWLDLVDLVIERGFPEMGQPRDKQILGPHNVTPLGPARRVIKSWMKHPQREPEHIELARLFLRRRK